MRKNWWIIPLLVLGFAGLFYILSKFSFQEIMGAFTGAHPLYFVGYLVVVVLIMCTLTWRWKAILHSQGHRFGFIDLLKYKIVGFGVNFITPGPRVGGEPVQATLTSKKYGISFEHALSSIVIDKTIELTTSGLFFVIGVIILLFKFALPEKLFWLLIVLSVLSVTLVIWFITKMLRGSAFFMPLIKILRIDRMAWVRKNESKIINFEKLIIAFYERDRRYFLYSILISLGSWVLMFLEYFFVMKFFGYTITPIQTFLIFSFVGMAYLFPIPLSLGVLEASQVSVFALLSINQAAAVGLAMIIRFKDVVWGLIGFTILFFHSLSSKDISIRDVVQRRITEPGLIEEIETMERKEEQAQKSHAEGTPSHHNQPHQHRT